MNKDQWSLISAYYLYATKNGTIFLYVEGYYYIIMIKKDTSYARALSVVIYELTVNIKDIADTAC